jgi:hypothetical protein
MSIKLVSMAVPHGVDPSGVFVQESLSPHTWDNGPQEVYGWHAHPYDKLLICVRGGITFHGRDADYAMGAGDRLDIDAGTEHAATVGPEGVLCMEAAR